LNFTKSLAFGLSLPHTVENRAFKLKGSQQRELLLAIPHELPNLRFCVKELRAERFLAVPLLPIPEHLLQRVNLGGQLIFSVALLALWLRGLAPHQEAEAIWVLHGYLEEAILGLVCLSCFPFPTLSLSEARQDGSTFS